ncbi:mucin-5AC isoform X2 [Ceratitis capitata]|uniref:mucin-5AC isoform X2 n=1 Tax=Ceratitis capitata TaxID=7213 RepID=UPI000329F053|nr:mucin-5AC isoform X2 [Ceratitis capitata]
MITRIPVATKLISTTIKTTITTPICNRSKSRAMQQHAKTVDLTTTPTQPTPPTVKHSHSHTTSRTTTTMHCWNIPTLQVLLLACILPLLLPPSTRRSYAAVALPITSKPIEGTAENLAWQAWLMLPPEQRQLEKSRKVTPKSIFSLPFRDCPPGHQLFQSRCIPTVNINQSDLLTQQVLGLFVGAEAAGGAAAGTAGGANVYEFDYGDEEYDLGLGEGEGESVMLFDVPQPFNSGGGGVGSVGTAAGPSNTQHTPVRDEPLKFNLFEQKFPTNDYEADLSSGNAMEGSGSARPFPELLAPTNGSEDAVQGFFQRHAAGGDADNNATLAAAIISTNNTNSTDHNNRIVNGNSTDRQVPSDDLHAAGSNVSAFSVDDIDAIILPAVSPGTTVKTISGGGDEGEGGSADVDLEPQHISLFKDEHSIKLLATVIAQQPASDNRIGGDSVAAGGDLIAASAHQQPHTVAQFLRTDALLPLSSVAPYITTTTTTRASTTTRVSTFEGRATAKRPAVSMAKDEHPRNVTQKSTATADAISSSTDTDAQETSFITTTEPEGTTNFQIDETTVVEVSAGDADAALPTSRDTLLEAILRQQHLEGQKSKVEKLKDVPTADVLLSAVNEETTTTETSTTTTEIETKTTTNEISETATQTETAAETVKPNSKLSAATTTTPQPLPTSAATAPSLIIATTTTAKSILAANSTPSTYRFRSTPTVASAAVTAIHTVTSKQVPVVVATTVPQQFASTHQAGAEMTTTKTTKTTSLNDDAVGSGEAVSDVPRSGNNDDLVNVVAASRNSINGDTNNDLNNKRKENNKNSPKRREPAAAEVNIEQELRMINELVKGNRQLAATKMAAIKTTETESATTTTTTTRAPPLLDSSTQLTIASETNSALEVQKSADTRAAAGELGAVSASGEVAVEVRQGVVGATTTTTTTTDNVRAVEGTTTLVPTPASASSDIFTTTTTNTKITTAKMESVNQSSEATITTVENSKFAAAETSTTGNELVTKTSAEPDYETETVEGTVDVVEGTGATTLWSRIMPIFGFGGEVAAAATATQEIAESVTVSSIGSSSSSSISDSSISFSENTRFDEHNNKHNNNNHNHNKFELPSRRNSKIIRIDHFDDNNVVNPSAATAVGATTTNTLKETAATATAITTTASANLKTTDDLAITPDQDPTEVSTFWWLPANWRLNRDTRNEEQQPLLFRLWSAFPESQMKAKAST